MKNNRHNDAEFMKRAEEIKRDHNFWNVLSGIGFKCTPYGIMDMCSIKHYCLPISHSFIYNNKTMEITKATIETGSWILNQEGLPIMSCENFVKWMKLEIRKMTTEILEKLDYTII